MIEPMASSKRMFKVQNSRFKVPAAQPSILNVRFVAREGAQRLLKRPAALSIQRQNRRAGIMKIKQIYHIGLPCNDLERGVKFYTEVLGMKCTKIGYDTESGGPYKDKYGMFPNIARLFMEDGMCLVLFQRPSSGERG